MPRLFLDNLSRVRNVKSRRFYFIATLLLFIVGLLLAWLLRPTEKEVLFHQLSTGMTQADLEQILGPPGNHTGNNKEYMLFNPPPACIDEYWLFVERGRSVLIIISFDVDSHRVVDKFIHVSWCYLIEDWFIYVSERFKIGI